MATSDYYRVRAWGTVGFIVASLALYNLLEQRGDLALILWCAMICALLGAG